MREKFIKIKVAFMVGLAWMLPISVSAATIYVGLGEEYSTIQDGVTAASSGDKIIVRNGLYNENIKINKNDIIITSEIEGEGPIVTAADGRDHVFTVNGHHVTIDGFVIYGAIYEKAGIYITPGNNYINIINNTCGLDKGHANHFGIWIGGDEKNEFVVNDHIKIAYNKCLYNFTHGIFTESTNYSDIIENTCENNGESGIYISKSGYNSISDNTCNFNRNGIKLAENVRYNTISVNACNYNLDGITLWQGIFNKITGNSTNYNNSRGIAVGESYYVENRIIENICKNNLIGIYLKMASGLVISGNGVSSNKWGIMGSYINYNTIMKNTVDANRFGISFYLSENNTVVLNSFINSEESHFSSIESTNSWYLPVAVYYDYTSGSIHRNRMGNHYDDQKGNDYDNDGLGNQTYPADGEGDLYPLWRPSNQYSIQAWWMSKDQKMYRDIIFSKPYYPSITLKGGEKMIWKVERPESAEVDFTEDEQWIGRLYFHSEPLEEGHTFTIEAGYTDGTNFFAGPKAAIIGDGNRVDFQYQMESVAFSIPAGHYLAVSVSNDNVGVDYDLRMEGTWTYLSHGLPEEETDRATYDFNGNGRTDILWRHIGTGVCGVWLMDGVPLDRYAPVGAREVQDWRIDGVGDINGDGKSDIIWRRPGPGLVEAWVPQNLNDAKDGWTSLSLGTIDGDQQHLAGTADFNADGREDLLWRNQATGEDTIWLMGEGGLSERVVMAKVGGGWDITGLGDVNGDGWIDILWRNQTSGAVAVWRLNGTTLESYQPLGDVSDLNWQIAGLGDVNGDGRDDVLWRNQADGRCAMWLMKGADGGESWRYLPLGTVTNQNWHIMGLRDFNGDKRADVLWRNQAEGDNALWVMGEEGRFDYQSLNKVRDSNWEIQ